MELGITIPLERFLRRSPPPHYGAETDRRFCWDLHVIDLREEYPIATEAQIKKVLK